MCGYKIYSSWYVAKAEISEFEIHQNWGWSLSDTTIFPDLYKSY